MFYKGTAQVEHICIAPECDVDAEYCISMMKAEQDNAFYVTTNYDDDWFWEFYLDGMTNYEMVKHMIIDVVFDCDTMDEVIAELDNAFGDIFEDIVVEYECECDGSCGEDCKCK